MAPRFRQLLGLCLGLQLLRHWGPPSFAGPGRPRRRQGRASGPQRPCRPRRRSLRAAARPSAHADRLDAEVWAFAEAVLPRPRHKKAKRQLIQRLSKIVQEVLHPRARIYGFGSSLNGCGEASSDIDLVVYMPPEKAWNLSQQEALQRVATAALEGKFSLLEQRMTARVPIVTLEMLDEDERPTGYTCDVSFQRLLPLHNTRLLRTYVELMPNLAALIVVVKRWAKQHGVAGTWERFISTYSWTLVAIYYCQVVHGLPSLHQLEASKGKASADDQDEEDGGEVAHNVEFAGLAAARQELGEGLPCRQVPLGELLRGFFEFYSTAYDWGREVISVRLGERRDLHEAEFSFGLRRNTLRRGRRRGQKWSASFPLFNIEDPIELERNLNFALKPMSVRRIYCKLTEAREHLVLGHGLADVLDMEQLPKPQPRCGRLGKTPWISGFLDLGRRPPCECGKCGRRFKSFSALLDHERDCSHLERLLLMLTS